jgi:hypothetical protein
MRCTRRNKNGTPGKDVDHKQDRVEDKGIAMVTTMTMLPGMRLRTT